MVAQQTWEPLRHHGDVDAVGMLDFAVNVHGAAPPEWLQRRLTSRIGDLASYPSADDDREAREAVARRHGRHPEEVLLLAGAAEGFVLLSGLDPRCAAVIHPSFTEPELALRTAGIDVKRVVLPPPFSLSEARVPESADLVVVGNPTNPTSVLHARADIEALRRPGRVIAVDEAFADMVPGEAASFAGTSAQDVLVFRSLTKTWALAGLRCGYVLGCPELLARLARNRPHWPVGTLQLEAIKACCEPDALERGAEIARRLTELRDYLIARLRELGQDTLTICEPATAPFVLVRTPAGAGLRQHLRERGIAVRRCDTFPGLSEDYVRVAVREHAQTDALVAAMREVL